jgi:hypothetical protein
MDECVILGVLNCCNDTGTQEELCVFLRVRERANEPDDSGAAAEVQQVSSARDLPASSHPDLQQAVDTEIDYSEAGLRPAASLRIYNVADLVMPLPGVRDAANVEFAPVVELIRASIDPDSWGQGADIQTYEATLSLVVRQTPENHDRISHLLSELRASYDRQICFSCQIVRLNGNAATVWLSQRVRLQTSDDGRQWALLSSMDGPQFLEEFVDVGGQVVSAPKLTVFANQPATVAMLNSGNTTKTPMMSLAVEPELLSEGGLLRLKHNVRIGPADQDATEFLTLTCANLEGLQMRSTLMQDGQTLVMVLPDQTEQETTATQSTYVVLITPQIIKEAELIAVP